ncbi:MAG: iron-sulfur cluster assembly protein [Bdellovibrionales bacterium]|jgi:FeS assembly SUF system protein
MSDVIQTPPEMTPAEDLAPIGERVIARIKTVFDPEIPVNVYDLGLIYNIDVATNEDKTYNVKIDMTLTSPNCPIADEIPLRVQEAVSKDEGARDVKVTLVWDPPWDKSRMTDEARMQLDMF